MGEHISKNIFIQALSIGLSFLVFIIIIIGNMPQLIQAFLKTQNQPMGVHHKPLDRRAGKIEVDNKERREGDMKWNMGAYLKEVYFSTSKFSITYRGN